MTAEARAWIISLACQKPTAVGWAPEFWSQELLARYVREHAVAMGPRSAEFVEFLQALDARYAADLKIQVVLDNHSAHTSRETHAYLATKPTRFQFVFTPTHGSWLNLIAMFFAKLSQQCLRGIRVASVEELEGRILQYLHWVNEDPVRFRWRYKLETLEAKSDPDAVTTN